MNILTISGSTRSESKNTQLLNYFGILFPEHSFNVFPIKKLPLFHPELDQPPLPEIIKSFKTEIKNSDAVIFTTPEYIYNIPASLKSALEWLTSSGELFDKKVLAITYTPNEPRGEKAMQSLVWSLTALDAKVLTSLSLYHTDISFDENGILKIKEGVLLLKEAIKLLTV